MSLASVFPDPSAIHASWFDSLPEPELAAVRASAVSWRLHAERLATQAWSLDPSCVGVAPGAPWAALCRVPAERLSALSDAALDWATCGTSPRSPSPLPLARTLSAESLSAIRRVGDADAAGVFALACAQHDDPGAALLALRFHRRLWTEALPRLGPAPGEVECRLGARLFSVLVAADGATPC